MNTNYESNNDPVWQMIDREKKKDKVIRRISRVAWGTTLILLLIFFGFTLYNLDIVHGRYERGMVPWSAVVSSVVPFAIILGSLSLIIAILSTIGMFLRLRTTSLLEIQQRLANLEQMVTNK